MPIVSLLALQFGPNDAQAGVAALVKSLEDTRAFPGCLGLEVLVEIDDPSRVTVVERWQSREHDLSYRRWRASSTEPNPVLALLVAEPVVTHYEAADAKP